MKTTLQLLLGFVTSLAFAGYTQAATVTSTFDTDRDGWTVSGDATSGIPDWVSSGGNPDGHIEADNTVSGGVWYFEAPGKFLGDQSAAYGQMLSFDLRQTGSGSQFSAVDIILNGGGLTLNLDAGTNPLPVGSWVSYSVLLSELGGWTEGGGAASQSDLMTTLGSLSRLRIRGEYISGSDTGRLDNVVLNSAPIPLPPALWLIGSATLCLLRWCR